MSYEEYWIKRADARMAEAHKGSDATIRKIQQAYQEAIEQLNKDIDRLFYRFAGENGLSEEKAKELLNEQLTSSEVQEIRNQIALIEDENIRKQLEQKLKTTITRARISRLEALKEDIYIQTSRMADVELRLSSERYFSVVEDEYLHNIFDIQQYLGFGFSFGKIPVNTIQEILRDDWSGKHYSKRIWKNSTITGKRIEETVAELLLKGTMLGTNSRKMAAELNKHSNVGLYACERLIRTETTYFVTMADVEAAKKRGTQKLRFVATLDNRTSKQCQEADGNIIPVSEAVPGKNVPPLHPFCRSVVIEIIKGLMHKKRIARDPATGKTYYVPADMTYKEWKEKYVDSGMMLVPEIKEPTMKKSLEDFDNILDKNDDGSSIFQMLRFSKENATFVEDRNMSGAYGYMESTDEFKYNPSDEYYGMYDMNYVYSHELAHRLDTTWCNSWENEAFLSAIEATRQKLYNNPKKIQEWLDGPPGDDVGFSDIVHALSWGEMSGIAGHELEYWISDQRNVPLEIFANMVYIRTMKPENVRGTEGFLEELFKALEEMI